MIINRCKNNPIISIKDVNPSNKELEVIGVFNCGVANYNGKTILLMRVAERAIAKERYVGVPMFDKTSGKIEVKHFDKSDKTIDFSDVRFVKTSYQLFLTSISHLRLAYSDNGIDFTISDVPFMVSDNEYEEFGIEDPRITFVEDFYYINYSAISRMGVVTSLARTKDFLTVEKLGVIFMADNKDVTIFPQKINGKYCALNRPVSAYFNKPEIWISYSDDLLSYGGHKVLCHLRSDKFDNARIGASCVPFLTSKGWVEIYHGCDNNNFYSLGALLLDANNPEIIIARSEKPILSSSYDYEKNGFMPNVIFSCGAIAKDDIVNIYYGVCDEAICLATFSLEDLFKELNV